MVQPDFGFITIYQSMKVMRKSEIINKLRNACKCCQNKRKGRKRRNLRLKSEKDNLKTTSTVLCGMTFLALLLLFLPWKDSSLYCDKKSKGELTTEQALFLRIIRDSCYVKIDRLKCGNQKVTERNDTCPIKTMSGYLLRMVDTLVLKMVEEKRPELIDSVESVSA